MPRSRQQCLGGMTALVKKVGTNVCWGIKAIHDIGPVVDANQGRHWNNNTMHAPDQMRPSSREALDLVEKASQDEVIDAESNVSFANRKYILISRVAHK